MIESRHYILKDKEVVSATLLEWAEFFEDTENRIINKTTVGKYSVSTVFLGLDHRFTSDGLPLIFETMVFCDDKEDGMYDYTERYSTYQEAEQGHLETLKFIEEKKRNK